MSYRHLLLSSLLAIGLCGLLRSPAQAQPDPNEAPKGENPPNWNQNAGRKLTPEQIRLLREQQLETRLTRLRKRLTDAGFTDDALQTAIVAEYKAQATNEGQNSAKLQKIYQATKDDKTPEADLAALLKDFHDSVDKENARRATALAALETQFQISKKPALDALLLFVGITDTE